jgi:TldD protein
MHSQKAKEMGLMSGEDLAHFAVEYARSRGASYAEARHEYQIGEQMILKNGVLDALGFSEDTGIGVRVLAKGGLAFSSTNRLNKGDVRDAVDSAMKKAKGAARKDPISFVKEDTVVTEWSVPEKVKIADVPTDQKIRDLVELDKTLLELKLKMPARMFVMSHNRIRKLYVNSEGSEIKSYSPRIRLYYYLTVAGEGDAEQSYRNYGWSGGWEALDELRIMDKVIEEAKSLQLTLEKGKKSPEGKMDLVVGPQVSGIASHESCGHPTEADRILGREASQAGKSFITPDMIGKKVGSEHVNVVDDPTLANAIAYYAYDDEGVKSRRRYLYKEGRINEFLQNRETAAKLGTRSNGAARATNYDREAIVRMANTFVEPKDWGVEEMLEEVKSGVYMESFMEWNIDDKRWNGKYVGREAYLIENGEVKHPVRKTVLEVTTPAFWSAVDAVGKDLEFEAGFCGKSDPTQALDAAFGGPTMRLRNIVLR